MERKTVMGLAAVAGIGLLLYMRKNADAQGVAGAGATVSAAGGVGAWGVNPVTINSTKPLAVDKTAIGTVPVATLAPPPAASGSATNFAGVGSDAPAQNVAYWVWSDVGQGKNGVPITDAARVAELDGVRAFATQHDLTSDKGTQDVFAAARGQGMSYNETLQTLGSAFKFTDREIAAHADKYGVGRW